MIGPICHLNAFLKRNLIPFLLLFWLTAANAQDRKISELISTVSVESLQTHLDSLCWARGFQSRITFTPGNYAAADYIADYFASLSGISHVERDTFYLAEAIPPYNTYPLINISARINGNSEDPETFLVGAHYDASASRQSDYSEMWYIRKATGADDNASGVAAILELARVLSTNTFSALNRHNIEFIACAAEEYHPNHPDNHHVGSLYDADKLNQNGDKIRGVLILDMVAYNTITNFIDIISDYPSTWLADSVYQYNNRYQTALLTREKPYPDVPYSDHESYQIYGYPAILLMEAARPWNDLPPYYYANPNYHTESDQIGTLRMTQLTGVTRLALATVAEITLAQTIAGIAQVHHDNSFGGIEIAPNPFNAHTRIQYSLAQNGFVQGDIFTIDGRKVKTLFAAYQPAGNHQVYWDGLNTSGDQIATGIYVFVLKSDMNNFTKKIVCLR